MTAVAWGCAAAVVLSAVQSLGITLQRKSHVIPFTNGLNDDSVIHMRRESTVSLEDPHRHTHMYKRNLWLVGFFLFIVANVFGLLVQLSTLPLIILSPLQSIGLIFNSILSCMLLPGETFTRKLAFGTLVIAVGAFTIAYNGGATETPGNVGTDERFRALLHKFSRPGFLTWWIFTFVAMAVLVRVNWGILARIKLQAQLPMRKTRRLSRHAADPVARMVFVRGVLYGIISGTLTAHTFLFAKSVVDVLVKTVLERETPHSLSTYVITVLLLVVTLSIVGLQLVAFNLGLSNILTSILYPLCFLVYNLVNLINDLSFNRLLASGTMSVGQLCWVVVGLFGVLLGVLMISWDSAFGRLLVAAEPLMTAKFPYELLPLARGSRVLSYEETELLNLILEDGL